MSRVRVIVFACVAFGAAAAIFAPAGRGDVDPFDEAFQAAPRKGQAKVDEKPDAGFVSPVTQRMRELIEIKASATPTAVRRGQVIRVVLDGEAKPIAYTYSAVRPVDPKSGKPTRISYKNPWVRPLYPIAEQGGVSYQSAFVLNDRFQWAQDVYVSPDAPTGKQTIVVTIAMMACTKVPPACLPPGEYVPLEIPVDVSDDPPLPPPADLEKRSVAPDLGDNRPPVPPPTTAQLNDLGGLLVGAFVGAILMLLTPCVFPMIPITVNFFIKQSEKEHHRPFFMASVYAGTIVLLLTAVVMLVGNSIIKLANEPWFNLGLGVVLILFALGLFGMFDVDLTKFFGTVLVLGVAFGLSRVIALALPGVATGAGEPYVALLSLVAALPATYLLASGLRRVEAMLGFEESAALQFLAHQESRGGMLGAAFMAMTFTITSFSCTGPFLGILLAPLAGTSLPWHQLLLGALVYAITFAAPFFLLALFPTFLKRLPKSGGWMTTIKVTMGFLEIGAALKFLANVDLFWFPGNPRIFNYDTVLCSWIALSLACGLYLLGLFRLHHDSVEDHIGVPRMIFACLFLGMAFYLSPLLVGTTPQGAVMEAAVSFLPLDLKEDDKIAWIKDDYPAAWKKAVAENKLIFIDFTGQNCANCRSNERNAFRKPYVVRELEKYVCVKLFTDSVPDPDLSASAAWDQGQKQQMWEYRLVRTVVNPMYVIFEPDPKEPFRDGIPAGRVVNQFEGLITNVPRFGKMLVSPTK